MAGQAAVNVIVNRKMLFDIFLKEQLLSIVFYGYSALFVSDLFFAEIEGSPCYAYSDSESVCAADGNITNMDSGEVYRLNHALSFYHSEPQKIFWSKSKKILSGTTFVGESDLLNDCTGITPRTLVTINGETYFALTANTLISISDGVQTTA